jgi:CHASE2 domain-containing sensor protein
MDRRRQLSRPALLALAFALVAAAVITTYTTGGLDGLERGSVDVRYRVRGPQRPDPRIAVVAVDDRTIAAVNRMPPIPRGYYARALDRLRSGGARLIAVDVQFVGAGPDRAEDDALVAAISRDGPVVLAAPDYGEAASAVPAGRPGTAGADLVSVGVDPDPDGVLRSMMYRQVDRPTLPVRVAQLLTGRPGGEYFTDNHAPIDFRGGPGTFPTISMIDLVRGRVPRSQIEGRTMLIGVTAPVQRDAFLTAASRVPLAGVEIHANALQTLLDGMPLRPVPTAFGILLLLVAAALPLGAALRLSSVQLLPAALLLLAGSVAAGQLAFDHGWIVPVVPIVAAVLLGTAGAVAADTWFERRRRRALEEATQDFVRPGEAALFISYRRSQSGFAAEALRNELVGRFPERSVFMDRARLVPGQSWPREIQQAVRGCSVMLVLIGPQWADARHPDGTRRLDDPHDWVRREVETALRQPGTVVLPLLTDGAAMPGEAELPDSLADLVRRQAFTLDGGRLHEEVDELVRAFQTVRRSETASR